MREVWQPAQDAKGADLDNPPRGNYSIKPKPIRKNYMQDTQNNTFNFPPQNRDDQDDSIAVNAVVARFGQNSTLSYEDICILINSRVHWQSNAKKAGYFDEVSYNDDDSLPPRNSY